MKKDEKKQVYTTGFGITEFRTVETLTFGLLTKNLAFKTHNNLWIPFMILLGLHVFFSLIKKRKGELIAKRP